MDTDTEQAVEQVDEQAEPVVAEPAAVESAEPADEPADRAAPVLESVNEPEPESLRGAVADVNTTPDVDTDVDDESPLRIRSFAVEEIRVAATADGRTVEAYAAVFDTPAEVTDADGHYLETISPKAFNRAINRPPFKPGVFYNHGLDLFGKPASGANTVPLGEALEVRADRRGVFTRARYHRGAFADEVLQAVKDGVITGQSFRGHFIRSTPARRAGRRWQPDENGQLRTVTREEIYPLVEFGPTPTPVYTDAAIVAVRSESLQRLRSLLSAPVDEVDPDDIVEAAEEALGEEVGRSAPSRQQVLTFQRIRAQAREKGFFR